MTDEPEEGAACKAQAGADVGTHLVVERHISSHVGDQRKVAPGVELPQGRTGS